MTPFSIILSLVVAIVILREKKEQTIFVSLLAITMTIQICSLGGYFIKIGSTEIDYVDVMLLLTAVFGFFVAKNRVNKKTFALSMLLTGWILLGLFLTVFFPPKTQIIPPSVSWDAYFYGRANRITASVSSSSILVLIKVVLTLMVLCFSPLLVDDDFVRVRKIVVTTSKIHIVWLVAEILTKNFLHLNIFPELRNAILGLGKSTITELTLRGTAYTAYGWTREASAVPEFLFAFIAILILSKSLEENKWWAIIGVIIMALSMSFSTIMFAAALVVLYVLVYQRRLSKKAIYSSMALILLVVIGIYFISNNQYYSSRLTGFVEDFLQIASSNNVVNGTITSSKVRLYGITETFKALMERPLLGFGLGTTYCNSAIIMIMANIGIIGFVLWIMTIRSTSKQHKKNALRWNVCFVMFLIVPNILKGSAALLYSTGIILVQHLLDILDEKISIRGGGKTS